MCADVEAYNATNPSTSPLVALKQIPGLEFMMARDIGRLFGFRVHIVSGGRRLQGVTDFKSAFVSEQCEHSPVWICAHEMWHMLHIQYPEHCLPKIPEIWECLSPTAFED